MPIALFPLNVFNWRLLILNPEENRFSPPAPTPRTVRDSETPERTAARADSAPWRPRRGTSRPRFQLGTPRPHRNPREGHSPRGCGCAGDRRAASFSQSPSEPSPRTAPLCRTAANGRERCAPAYGTWR